MAEEKEEEEEKRRMTHVLARDERTGMTPLSQPQPLQLQAAASGAAPSRCRGPLLLHLLRLPVAAS